MDKIGIVFEETNDNATESIKEYEGLKRRFCEVITLGEINKNPQILKDYKGLLDCTVGNKFYNNTISKNSGREFKVADNSYVKTATDKFIVCGPGIITLTASRYSKADHVLEREIKNFELYDSRVKFLYTLIRSINNLLMYEEGVSAQGIVLNSILEKTNEKTYLLVKEIPLRKESGVIYITPDDIKILNDLINLKGVIV